MPLLHLSFTWIYPWPSLQLATVSLPSLFSYLCFSSFKKIIIKLNYNKAIISSPSCLLPPHVTAKVAHSLSLGKVRDGMTVLTDQCWNWTSKMLPCMHYDPGYTNFSSVNWLLLNHPSVFSSIKWELSYIPPKVMRLEWIKASNTFRSVPGRKDAFKNYHFINNIRIIFNFFMGSTYTCFHCF